MTSNVNISKKIKTNINYLNEYILYILFGISIVLKCLYFQLNSQIGTTIGESAIVFSSIGIILIIFSALFLAKPKNRMILTFIVYVLISILLLSDAIYFKYYSNVITISLLKLSKFAGDVTESINGLLEFKDIFYVIDIPLFIVLMILTGKKTKREVPFLKRLRGALYIIVIGFLVLAVPYSFSNSRKYKYDQGKAIKEMGVLYYHYYDTKKYIDDYILRSKKLTVIDKKRITDFYKSKVEQDKKNVNKRYTGIAKGKNLIVVQVEAFQQFAVNRVYNGQEVTPNINKLIKNSIYFKNFYYQARSGNTADAEFLTNNSMYSFQHMAGIPYVNYPNNKYHSLAKSLKAEGYHTYAFHGYKGSFWNRATMYQSLGFENFMSMKDFSKNKNFGMGINDIDMFKESLDNLQKMNKDDKPFFGYFVTLSTHYSYDNFAGKYPFNIKGLEGTTVGKFLRAANYADKAIASLIADLKKRGLYDNTLIVIYGDHNAVGKMQFNEMKKLLNKNNISDLEWEQLQKVPCVITGGPIKKDMYETVSTTGGEVDTMPTIANLMDFKVPYAVGKDLLNTKFGSGYAFSIGRDDSFITDRYCFIDSLGKAFDLKSGRELKLEEYKNMLDYGHNVTYMTDMIISKNAFKNFSLK